MINIAKDSKIVVMILAGLILMFARNWAFAAVTKPDKKEVEREEYRLKQKLEPLLLDVLKKNYLAMSVNIVYVLQRDPIVAPKAKIHQFKLPGFGSKATIASKANEISGYVDRYERYRMIVLMVNQPISATVEESLLNLMRDKGELDLGQKDRFNLEIVAAQQRKGKKRLNVEDEKKQKQQRAKIEDLVQKIKDDQTAREERLALLFPELKQPLKPVDSRKEAESSKHLIASRNEYFAGNLNNALNEVIKAIDINPYSSKSYEMLGSIYYRLKWYNLALTNWIKALALDPENKKLNQYIDKVRKQI